MIDVLKKLFGSENGQTAAPVDHGPDKTWVATAVLLLEMAHTDDGLHEMESDLVDHLLSERFNLDPQTLSELRQFAEQRRRDSLDLYQFAKEINDHFSKEEKLEVMDHLWQVVFADGRIDPYEEALSRQLATLLRLTHKEMIDSKLRVRKILEKERDGGTVQE